MALPTMPLTGRPLADVAVFGVQEALRRAEQAAVGRALVGRRAASGAVPSAPRPRPTGTGRGSSSPSSRASGSTAETGEPLSWQPLPDEVQAHEWARRWLGEQWDEWAPRTRALGDRGLHPSRCRCSCRRRRRRRPHGLRAYLVGVAAARRRRSPTRMPRRGWRSWSLQLGQLNRPVFADGRSGAGRRRRRRSRWRRRPRAGSGRCRVRASAGPSTLGVLDADPWPPAPRGRRQRKAGRASSAVVDVRCATRSRRRWRRAIEAIPSHQPASRTYQVDDRGRLLRRAPPVRGRHAPAAGRSPAGRRAGGASTSSRPTCPSTSPVSRRPDRARCRSRRLLVEMLRAWIADRRVHRRRPPVPHSRRRPSDVVELVAIVAAGTGEDRPSADADLRLPPRRRHDVADAPASRSARSPRRHGPQRRNAGLDLRRRARRRRGGRRTRGSMQSSRRRGSLPETPCAAEYLRERFRSPPVPTVMDTHWARAVPDIRLTAPRGTSLRTASSGSP